MLNRYDIRDYISNVTSYELMQMLHFYNSVNQLNIDKKVDGYEINATINTLGFEYQCQIKMDLNEKILDYQCTCPFNHEAGPCGHIGAVLLKIKQQNIKEFPYSYQFSRFENLRQRSIEREIQKRKDIIFQETKNTKALINQSKAMYELSLRTQMSDTKISIEPRLSTYLYEDVYRFAISFKIGTTKKYVIKSLNEFLDCINKKTEYSYGKTLSFVHDINIFDEHAKDQINFIQNMNTKQYQIESGLRCENYFPHQHDKEIALTPSVFDKFFDLYEEYATDDFTMVDLDEKIKLSITQEYSSYVVKIESECPLIYGQKHLYTYEELSNQKIFYRIKLDEEGKALSFIKAFHANEFYIGQEDYDSFYKYVFSPISEYFEIENDIEMPQIEYIMTRIYGDVDENGEIFFKVFYMDENQNKKLAFHSGIVTSYEQDYIESIFYKFASFIDEEKHIAYFDINEEKTYTFIHEELEKLKEFAEVYVSESLKKLGRKAEYHLTVGVQVVNDLLAIDIESLEIPKKDISKILEEYRRKRKFYRLKTGELVYLESEQLEELSSFMEKNNIDPKRIKNGHIELNKNKMFTLDEEMNNLETIETKRQDAFVELIDCFNDYSKQNHELPQSYQTILRDYQKDGFKWLSTLYQYGFNGILADDMGLGKTLQVISLLESLDTTKPSLVVCPASLIYNWEDEVNKFTTNLPVTCIVGNPENRKNIISTITGKVLYVTSYDYIRKDIHLYENILFEYVILDEAQYIKNLKTKSAISVKQLHASHKLALSGTPIENSLAELWSIMDFLMPQYLYNYHYFRKHYEVDIVRNNDEEKIKKLKSMVTPFILRRNKKEVLTELPDKIEKTQIIPFTEKENELYLANLAQANNELQSILQMENVDSFEILALLTRLRQICCEPRLLYENIEESSSKMKACIELIQSFKENNQKVLLFSTFKSALYLLEDELKMLGIKYFILTGDTSKETRRELVEKFQNGQADVFLISLKAGGTGLNLTAAQAVIHFDPWWNVSAQNQATDRAYRIGQHSNVQVYKLVMKNSIEEKILVLQEKKKELADLFVENNEGSIARMTKDQIRELFS